MRFVGLGMRFVGLGMRFRWKVWSEGEFFDVGKWRLIPL